MLADGRNDTCNLIRGHTQAAQDLKGQQRPAVCMIYPVDTVADIVHISGNTGQLAHALFIAQGRQDSGRALGDLTGVLAGVFGIAERPQGVVAALHERGDLLVVSDLFIGDLRIFHRSPSQCL